MKALGLLLFLFTVAITAQVKKPEPPPVEIPFAESRQAVVVTTDDWTGTKGESQLYERNDLRSKWRKVGDEFSIVVGRGGLAWGQDSAPEETNNAPTLAPVFKAYCNAQTNKDEAALRKAYSLATITEFEQQMKEEGIITISEFLADDMASNEFCEVRNEQINGETATAKVSTRGYPNGLTIVFIKENGAWKITNKPPRPKSHVMKKEGDGKSPAGMFPLTFAFGKSDSSGSSKLSYRKIDSHTECVDDVNSFHYNRVVSSIQVGNFDWKSSEKMAEITPEYDLGVFVAYNSYPVVKAMVRVFSFTLGRMLIRQPAAVPQ